MFKCISVIWWASLLSGSSIDFLLSKWLPLKLHASIKQSFPVSKKSLKILNLQTTWKRSHKGCIKSLFMRINRNKEQKNLENMVSSFFYKYSQTCSNDHLNRTTTSLTQHMLSSPKQIPIQLRLAINFFVSQMNKNLSKTTITKLYAAKKWKANTRQQCKKI